MKKLYALTTLALGCTLSLTAGAHRQPAKSDLTPKASAFSMAVSPSLRTQAMMKAAPADDAREYPEVSAIAGEYDLSSETLLQQGVSNFVVQIEVIDEVAGEVSISGFPQNYEISAYYDAETGTLSVDNNQYLGPDGYGDDNYFYLKSIVTVGGKMDLNQGATDADATIGKFNNNVFTFPADEIWAIGDPNAEDLGWWFMSSDVVLTRYDEGDPNEGWTSIGNATFQDGWLLPAFNIDQTNQENWYEVELQQNDANKNVYRLVDPYHGDSPIANYNEYQRKGYIQFDVTDPDHVVFEALSAGFAYSQMGVTQFYPYNSLTAMILYSGVDAESVIATMGDRIPYTTFKDGVVTLGSDGNGGYDAVFGIQDKIDAAYSWQTQSGKVPNMEVKIFFPGYAPRPADPNEGWTSVGDATIEDGWMLPAIGLDQTNEANWYKAELQQNDENPNIFRVVDPYKGNWPGVQYNTSRKTGYIQFDITDPDHVTFEPVGAGLTIPQLSITEFYCYNTLTHGILYTGLSAAELVAQEGDAIPYTTYKDGVLLLPSEDIGAEGYFNDACIGVSGAIDGGYGWQDMYGYMKDMVARIIFPDEFVNSVAKVGADNENLPVEMYNLQGVRVVNPAQGQVMIRRQGTKTEKILVR